MTKMLWMCLFAVVLPAQALAADDESQAPPILEFGGSRSSSDWVSMPNGTRVAVGKSVQWKGVKVYLSLTWDLVGVDATSGKTRFGTSVGAFWNCITFKEVTPKGGEEQWAIELRPGKRSRHPARRQYHDLRTGKKLDVPGLAQTPSGTPFKPRLLWQGDNSHIAQRFGVILSTPENWKKFQERMFSGLETPAFEAVDFEKEIVVALSSGNSSNSRGIGFISAFEDDKRVLLRVNHSSFQTMDGYQKCRPWGLFVLPRRPTKAYEVERNTQGLIGGPPIWKRIHAFARIGPPETELAAVPAKSNTPHHGWATSD